MLAAAPAGAAKLRQPDPCVPASWRPADPADPAPFERDTACRVNRARAASGLRPLRLSRRLTEAAGEYALELGAADALSHRSPDGESVADRIRASGYAASSRGAWFAAGEALGSATLELAAPQAMVDGWLRSEAHRPIVVAPRARHIGVGIVLDPAMAEDAPGATYVLYTARRARARRR